MQFSLFFPGSLRFLILSNSLKARKEGSWQEGRANFRNLTPGTMGQEQPGGGGIIAGCQPQWRRTITMGGLFLFRSYANRKRIMNKVRTSRGVTLHSTPLFFGPENGARDSRSSSSSSWLPGIHSFIFERFRG